MTNKPHDAPIDWVKFCFMLFLAAFAAGTLIGLWDLAMWLRSLPVML